MKKENRNFLIYISIILVIVSIMISMAILNKNTEHELYEKILNLDWSEYIPENYSGFDHWTPKYPVMKGRVVEDRDNWVYIKVLMLHYTDPTKDKAVGLYYNTERDEQMLKDW